MGWWQQIISLYKSGIRFPCNETSRQSIYPTKPHEKPWKPPRKTCQYPVECSYFSFRFPSSVMDGESKEDSHCHLIQIDSGACRHAFLSAFVRLTTVRSWNGDISCKIWSTPRPNLTEDLLVTLLDWCARRYDAIANIPYTSWMWASSLFTTCRIFRLSYIFSSFRFFPNSILCVHQELLQISRQSMKKWKHEKMKRETESISFTSVYLYALFTPSACLLARLPSTPSTTTLNPATNLEIQVYM